MKTEEVYFYSEGCRLGALWRRPDSPQANGRLRAIVQGPGWLGLKDAGLYVRYHEALTAAGFGVLVFDYRGFGDSEGDHHRLVLTDQLRDLINAVTYVAARDDVDPDAIGVFGTGGTGGGNAVLLAAADNRIRAAVSQVPVADGADWLHRMRAEHEWLAFLRALAEDRTQRVLTGTGQMVSPLEEIMVPTPERRATTIKSDVDDRVSAKVPLAVADEIIAYQPIAAAAGLTTPLMVIGVENDATTPSDHAHRLFDAARGPKALIMQRHTTHYAAYDQYWNAVTPQIIAWFNEYVKPADLVMRRSPNALEDTETLEVLK